MDFIKVGDVHTVGTISGVCTPSNANDRMSCLMCAFFSVICKDIDCLKEDREDGQDVNFIMTKESKTL